MTQYQFLSPMSRDDASRNFIIVVRNQERWLSFLDLNADVKEAIREDRMLEDYSTLLPSDVILTTGNLVRRISFINQRYLNSIQKKLKNVVTYCMIDSRDSRTKDFRPVYKRNKAKSCKDLICSECSKLLAEKTRSHSESADEPHSGKVSPDRRQDLSNFETLEKKVKIEATKIES